MQLNYTEIKFLTLQEDYVSSKNVKKRTLIILCVVFLAIGFLAGQFIPLPVFDNINIWATMGGRPGSQHNRQ